MADHKRHQAFRLSREMRRALRTDINVEALEQLLGLVPPESRDLIVRAFLARPRTDSASHEIGRDESAARNGTSIGYDISFRDPGLQRLLQQVTAPSGHAHVVALVRTRPINSRERRLLEEPIGLAIVSDLGAPNAAALVIRGHRSGPHDLIALTEQHPEARWFDRAIRRLLTERRERGLRPRRPYRVTIPIARSTRRLPGPWERYVLQILERARASALRPLGELGTVRFMEFRLMQKE